MKTIVRMNKWANAHTSIALDVLRIGLGIFLFWKGIQFAGQTKELVHLINPDDPDSMTLILAHYIAMSHFSGGILVVVGLLTRLSLAFQYPILIGAVIINFTGVMDISALIQAIAAFLVATFFLIVGSGKHSVDYTLKMNV